LPSKWLSLIGFSSFLFQLICDEPIELIEGLSGFSAYEEEDVIHLTSSQIADRKCNYRRVGIFLKVNQWTEWQADGFFIFQGNSLFYLRSSLVNTAAFLPRFVVAFVVDFGLAESGMGERFMITSNTIELQDSRVASDSSAYQRASAA
jgi:hypothetical protein